MKYIKKWLGKSVSCIHSAVTNPGFQTEEYLAQYDMKNEYTQAQGMIDKENGIYYFCPLGSVYVYYYDEETDTQGKLCAKPECTHEDASCNAYLGVSNIGIQIYDHSLYWIQGGSLYRMDLNGENHEEVRTIDVLYGVDPLFAVHRGFLYTFVLQNEVQQGDSEMTLWIRRYSLDDAEQAGQTLYQEEQGSLASYRYHMYGNSLYFLCNQAMDDTYTEYEATLYVYDTEADQCEVLWSENQLLWDMGADFKKDKGTIQIMGAGGYRTIPFFQIYILGDSGEVQKEGPFYLGEAYAGRGSRFYFTRDYIIQSKPDAGGEGLRYCVRDDQGEIVMEGECAQEYGAEIDYWLQEGQDVIMEQNITHSLDDNQLMHAYQITRISADGSQQALLRVEE